MELKKDKRIIVLNILSGSTGLDSPLIERSVLTGIAELKRPNLKEPGQVWLVGVPILFLVFGFGLVFHKAFENPQLLAAGILAYLCLCILVWHVARQRDEALRRHIKILQEPVEELRELQGVIKNYLAALDKRTRQYFHLVTNSKVTSYFVLSQISNALEERITEVSELLSVPRRENVLVAHQLLQGTIFFGDSFKVGAGNTHIVPLARLKVAVLQIFEFLDSELKLLEEELTIQPEEDSEEVRPEEQGEPH
jgi:hypothetical protein